MEKDVTSFLKTNSPVAELIKNPSPFQYRKMSLLGFRKKFISFKECLGLMFPSSFSIKRRYVSRQLEFLDREAREELSEFLSPDGAAPLLGNPFYFQNCEEFLFLVDQIVVGDQYHVKDFLKKDSIVIDAGANIGVFSAFASTIAPSGHVYAFEPVNSTAEFLKKNVTPYSSVTVVKKGLGDAIASKKIFVTHNDSGSSVLEDSPFFKPQKNNGVSEDIEITTVDNFVAEAKLPRVDFIKIDTEGYEAKILTGAAETIKKFHPVIAMSAYHNPNDKEDLPRLLKSISPEYVCELHNDREADFICYQKTNSA